MKLNELGIAELEREIAVLEEKRDYMKKSATNREKQSTIRILLKWKEQSDIVTKKRNCREAIKDNGVWERTKELEEEIKNLEKGLELRDRELDRDYSVINAFREEKDELECEVQGLKRRLDIMKMMASKETTEKGPYLVKKKI
ncbi:MAG: hypothetical protein PHN72_06155 [Bacilli bacterium]|nr:hypothetical protein [Bacilli bacterium]